MHVFFHGPVASAFVTLAAAAAVTGRIRLLSAATLLPVYPMVLAAKMAATLDLVSQGRFELGVGVGGSTRRNSPRAASRWPGGARAPTRRSRSWCSCCPARG